MVKGLESDKNIISDEVTWDKSTFGSITKALKTKIAQLKAAEAGSMRGMNHDTVIVLKKEVQNLLS